MKFFVSTDSTADLFAKEIEDMQIGFLPLTLTIEDNGIRMVDDNFTCEEQYIEFYNLLRKGIGAKTSMNNAEKHVRYFTHLAEQGHRKIIHFTISYGLAPTMDAAHTAIEQVKQIYPDLDIVVVESHTTTVGQGILVKTAYRMQQEGKEMQEVVDYVENMKHHIQHFMIVDDLQHLKRGGRVSGAAAAIGTMLQLKVILSFDRDGKLTVIDKVVGGMKKAIKAVVDMGSAFTPIKGDCHLTVVHTDNTKGAEWLSSALQEQFGLQPEVRIMGPTIGCHVGPNSVNYIFVSEELRPVTK
ncbi:MAG: DegV family protein [Clostridia bacterium]|nr:DegV family protein [Clostridia bacterium]